MQVERITSKPVMGEKYHIWDVETDKARWWVISPLTNLYSQADFPSMDVALTYHVGLRIRLANRPDPGVPDEQVKRTLVSWRKWEQAVEAAGQAEEPEDFQAVGMRLRECLIAFVKETWKDEWLSDTESAPKRADFSNWIKIMASMVAPGDSAARIRAYLTETARTGWELVQWLTHTSNATRFDAEIALHAVNQILGTLTYVLIRYERGPPSCRPELSVQLLLPVPPPEPKVPKNPSKTPGGRSRPPSK